MHVVITGASSGIGEAIAREWAAAGAELTLVARRRALLDALAASLKVRCHIVEQDLSEPAKAASFLDGAVQALGPVDVLVNNAGAQIIAPTAGTDIERAEASLRLNLLTPLRLTRAVLPGMLERKRGCIVDISSMAALAPTPGMTWYNAAKGGLAGASEALRAELRGTGVHVVTVYPGPVHSALADAGIAAYGGLAAKIPAGDPAVLARKVRLAAERRKARVIYPGFYGLTRWFPLSSRWFVERFTPKPRT